MLTSVFVFLISSFVHAGASSPVGFWKTIDDKTGDAKAIVQISQEGEEVRGKIVKQFPKPGDKTICEKCSGDKKDKPIEGLEIVWGLKDKGDEWGGGEILDPKTGTVYSAKMEVIENGAKLKVRGFLGFSLLGRSQTWLRDQDPSASPKNP